MEIIPEYKYVGNDAIEYFDERGLLTIDGTNYNTVKHAKQKSNVSEILKNVNEKTRYYGGSGSNDESRGFADATGTAISNNELGFEEIRDTVYSDICSEYLKK